ncbi:hypothetical protein [Pseudofrankia asymbiotica]|uniref:Uncharacterized protein n=1 Tax=Pseudofrankia asymbiotica TaxID=1834516 RepID=A0A1V2I3S7_9ACTN|nr:hypothetical protein [Pseudofrankia asymbiotica]ONH24881.1 hypothetical protein BL253_28825 [Pseudofrankia asymbiotica]
MESAETPPDEEYPWPDGGIADESHRLPEGRRLFAHYLITEQYATRQRALPSGSDGDGDGDGESPFADVSIGDGGAWEA